MSSQGLSKIVQVTLALARYPFRKAFRPAETAEPRTLLVAQVARIGDFLCTIPLMHSLREKYPQAEITALCPPALVRFLSRNPFGVRLIPFANKDVVSVMRAVRSGPYDEIAVPWKARDVLLAGAIGAKKIVTVEGNRDASFGVLADDFRPWRTGAYDESFSSVCPPDTARVFCLPSDWVKPAASRNRNVFLHVGVSEKNRYWTPACWAKVARFAEQAGFTPVWSGLASDAAFIAEADPEGRYRSTAGKLSLESLADELAAASLLITLDTGVLHLAKFTGVPIVGIVGTTPAEAIRPSAYFPSTAWRIVESEFPCEIREKGGCTWDRCPHKAGEFSGCMAEIPAERVIGAAREVLAQSLEQHPAN